MVASKQTRLKMRKGFVAAPLTYKVLMVTQFTDEDMKIISKGLIKAVTPVKARELLPTPQQSKSKWMLRSVSHVGTFDVQILMYKGLEVALYLKRQTSIVTPELGDPAPEGCIESEDDVWARLDLFSKSPRQLVGSVANELAAKDLEITRLHIELESKDRLGKHYEIIGLRNELKAKEHELDTAAKQIKVLTSQLALAKRKPKK